MAEYDEVLAPPAITITLDVTDNNREITYAVNQPDFDGFKVKAKRKQTVSWTSQYAFSVSFLHTPFTQATFVGAGGAVVGDTVRSKTGSGSYKFTVTLFTGAGTPLIDDPEIYVE